MNDYKYSHLIWDLLPTFLHSSPPLPRPLTSPSLCLKVSILFPRCFHNFVASAYPRSTGHWYRVIYRFRFSSKLTCPPKLYKKSIAKGRVQKYFLVRKVHKAPHP